MKIGIQVARPYRWLARLGSGSPRSRRTSARTLRASSQGTNAISHSAFSGRLKSCAGTLPQFAAVKTARNATHASRAMHPAPKRTSRPKHSSRGDQMYGSTTDDGTVRWTTGTSVRASAMRNMPTDNGDASGTRASNHRRPARDAHSDTNRQNRKRGIRPSGRARRSGRRPGYVRPSQYSADASWRSVGASVSASRSAVEAMAGCDRIARTFAGESS